MIRPRPTRGGYALIEMVLAVGAIAIVMGLCGGLLHVLLRLDRTCRAHIVETATIGRLARQFRIDVHAASGARAAGAGDGPAANLDLTLPEDRTIVYEARERTVARTERHGATVERREAYALPYCRESRFLVRRTDGQVWVSLELRRGTADSNDAGPASLRHDLQLEALMGKHLGRSEPKEPPAKKETEE